MSILSKGTNFGATEQVTSTKLDNLVDNAKFTNFSAAAVNYTGTTGTCLQGGGLEVTSAGQLQLQDGELDLVKLSTALKDSIHPVGSVYINATVATNPGTLLGFGTWTAFGAGRVPVGIDSSDTDFDAAEETGGAKTHTLSISEMPAHDHVANRNAFDTSNVLLTRRSDGGGSTGSTDSSVGEVSVGGNYGLPEVEGSGAAHNNLQPYIVVYMWKRTA